MYIHSRAIINTVQNCYFRGIWAHVHKYMVTEVMENGGPLEGYQIPFIPV